MDARIVDHALHPGGVAVRGQALPRVPEIPVVVVEAHRQAVDDARGQVLRIGLPLLARVVLDERLVQRAADQRNALVVEVLRVRARQFAGLLVDQGLRLGRRVVRVEELVDGPEVDRQGIHLAVVRGVHAVHVVREACETVHIVPDPLVGRVEQVRAVLVDLRAGLLVHVAVRVAADPMWSRTSMISTLTPRCSTACWATVRPNRPAPTTTRSGYSTASVIRKQPSKRYRCLSQPRKRTGVACDSFSSVPVRLVGAARSGHGVIWQEPPRGGMSPNSPRAGMQQG